MARLEVKIVAEQGDTPEEIATLEKGGDQLLRLCRKTVDAFDIQMRQSPDPQLKEGLVKWEKNVCEGMLYQMLRGQIYAKKTTDDPPSINLP